ncbi:hypothetical protein RHMOL_Rhmol06G0325400 [Rhododendron molle]|uniref:Uncharacterized protein n=1 Tax=Rhododendron molle TaxID=49168 RepID=A0ACC0NIV1_RHOML|nr:hypothetical protein RHMOL_Rhmol06G0325400 [Rhododendron molle]
MPNFQFRTNLPFNFPHFTDCPGLPNSRLQTPTPSTSPEGTTTTALSKLQQPTTRPPRRRSQLIPDDALSLLAHGQLLSIVQSTALRHPDVLNAFGTNGHMRFSAGLPNSRLQTPTPSTSPEGTTTTALSKLQQPTTRPPRRRSQLIPDDALSLLAHGQLLSIVQSTALRHPDVLNAFRTNGHLRFSAGFLYYAASGYWISGYCGLKVVFAGVLLVSSPAPFVVVDFCVFRRCRRDCDSDHRDSNTIQSVVVFRLHNCCMSLESQSLGDAAKEGKEKKRNEIPEQGLK